VTDRYGEAEWARHERSPSARVGFAVHCALPGVLDGGTHMLAAPRAG
jgi:hypothetical protein